MADEAYKAKSFEEIYEQMQTVVFGKVITATDANSGGVLCSLLEAVSRVVSEAYLHCKIGYTDYLNELVENALGVKRKIGTKAKGFQKELKLPVGILSILPRQWE